MFDENPAVNYERYFVPAIGAPLAADLVRAAALSPGHRVLDVACGTGIVARLASQQTDAIGTIAGLDVNPGMVAVAHSSTPSDVAIKWYEASANEMPLPDESFDVVLCQMGLQFMPDKRAALKEIWRVLAPGGRLILNVPGPTPRPLAIMEEALESHIGAEAAGFVKQVFSLNDIEEIENLMNTAGFFDVSVRSEMKSLQLPVPEEFLWQYVQSTPLAGALANIDNERLALLERDFVAEARE